MSIKIGEIEPKESYQIISINSPDDIHIDYSVTFRITEACDLKCSYCHWYGGNNYKFEDVISTIDKLFEFFIKERMSSVLFYYHGGEPTRHRRVLDILKYIKSKSEDTGITAYNEMQTNLTLKPELLNDILPYCDSFNVSFHYLELTKRGNKLEVFNNNFDDLVKRNTKIHNFDIMLENVPEENLADFYKYIKKYLTYENISNSEMIYGFCHYKYNEETAKQHLEFYEKYNKTEQRYLIDGVEYNTNDLFKKGVNCVGWHCAAGTDSITINGNGDVFNCGIHMTNYLRECIPETPYTNLITEKVALTKLSILYKTGTLCRWDYCGGDFYLDRNKI
jgi:MoaA/NifB/PqqE/SkfB family radical SAM enzyme